MGDFSRGVWEGRKGSGTNIGYRNTMVLLMYLSTRVGAGPVGEGLGLDVYTWQT